MVHLLHSPGILSLRACALTDDNRLQLPLSQQFHQRLRLRAELGLGKGPVALFAARRILDAGKMHMEPFCPLAPAAGFCDDGAVAGAGNTLPAPTKAAALWAAA